MIDISAYNHNKTLSLSVSVQMLPKLNSNAESNVKKNNTHFWLCVITFAAEASKTSVSTTPATAHDIINGEIGYTNL